MLKKIIKNLLLKIKIFYIQRSHDIDIGDNVKIIESNGKVIFAENIKVDDNVLLHAKGGNLYIGNNCAISRGSVLVAERADLILGNDVLIGEYSSIRTCDHGMKKENLIRIQREKGSNITIGNDVWIGRGCAVLKGSIIPEGCILGANSIFNHKINCEEYSILVGSPAKFIKVRE